jgi:hypothetical protein
MDLDYDPGKKEVNYFVKLFNGTMKVGKMAGKNGLQ